MMINGAVTIGTLDGANVEIRQAVGPESIFIFGKREHEVREALQRGYNAFEIYEKDPVLKRAVDSLQTGFAGKTFDVTMMSTTLRYDDTQTLLSRIESL